MIFLIDNHSSLLYYNALYGSFIFALFFFGLAIDFIYQNVFSYVVVRSMN